MKIVKALSAVIATLVLIWALQTKFAGLPPIGRFLNPVDGFWQNAESKNAYADEELKLDGLQGKVTIKYDDNRIPHIFAENDHDLYFAQGFVTARDRLWEMDIQTRKASGRLAEIIGPQALGVDRYTRRMGMVYGAENTLKGIEKDPLMKQVVNAYTDGVNAYIHSLSPRSYPLEFKLLDYAPEDWKPINCAFLLKLMSQTLAGGSSQFELTNVLKQFGPKVTADLFPDQKYHNDPIIPVGTKFDFKPLPIPQPSKTFLAQQTDSINTAKIKEGIGSNNWAISGSKTATGYPILANDPHLDLSFPSIWYQVQLNAPGANTYGVSLPGAPCIIIGYNEKISWGVTNVDADVLDWYQVKFKDASKNEYWYNNQWTKTKRRIEVIKVHGQKDVVDTVIYTHHGPVVYETANKRDKDAKQEVTAGNALRWIAHDESDEFLTFYLLNRGKNYTDYRAALTHFTAPAQNFVFASADNDIAITPNGKFPLKFWDQGKFILDGSDPQNDWHGWIPPEQNPTVKNPPRGFVSSANQSYTDKTYPYYITWDMGPYERGHRINNLLGSMKKATADSIRVMQTDNYSIRAYDVLPTLMKYIDGAKLNPQQTSAYKILQQWDKRYDANSVGATIFDRWFDQLYQSIWNDKFANKKTLLKLPTYDRTEKLLIEEPNSKWFDNTQTPQVETIKDVVNSSFVQAVNGLQSNYGQATKTWQWGLVKRTYINHLAKLDGFGTGDFVAGGASNVINALRGGNGPSWRMVVQLGPQMQGYGVFPGGESGNPGSFYYDDMFKTWKDGKLNALLFLQSPAATSNRIKSTLTLSK